MCPWPSICFHGPSSKFLDLLPPASLSPVQKRDAQHMFLQHKGSHTDRYFRDPCDRDPPKENFKNFTFWRQIWRVAGRESGFPELLGSPRTSPEVPRTSPEVSGDFPGSSLTVELNSNPEVPRKFPKLPRKFPKLPRKFPDFPGGQPLSLGSLTPSPDSQKTFSEHSSKIP